MINRFLPIPAGPVCMHGKALLTLLISFWHPKHGNRASTFPKNQARRDCTLKDSSINAAPNLLKRMAYLVATALRGSIRVSLF